MVKIRFQGKKIDATPVQVEESNETWSEYKLEDGTIIRLKTLLVKVHRADEEKNEIGEPIYVLQTQAITVADVDPELMEE